MKKNDFISHHASFWDGDNFEIGLPVNATEPESWRMTVYLDALVNAPSQQARQKLIDDNAHWSPT